MAAPLLNMPAASARSRAGNHSVTTFTAAGQLPASPMPSKKRKPASDHGPVASACRMPAVDHHAMHSAYPNRVPRRSKKRPRKTVRDRVGKHEGREHVAVRLVAHPEFFAQGRRDDRKCLTIQVVDDRRGKCEANHHPTHAQGPFVARAQRAVKNQCQLAGTYSPAYSGSGSRASIGGGQ